MTYIKLLSLSITNKFNIRIENVRIPGYVLMTAIILLAILIGLKTIGTH